MFSSASLALWSENTVCLLGQYTRTHCVGFGCTTAAFGLRRGKSHIRRSKHHQVCVGHDRLAGNDCIASGPLTPHLVENHWLFKECPFFLHGHCPFGENEESALKCFKDSRAKAKSLGLSMTTTTNPSLPFALCVATVGGINCVLSHPATKDNRLPSLFVAVNTVPQTS